jgi:hypothetical protein
MTGITQTSTVRTTRHVISLMRFVALLLADVLVKMSFWLVAMFLVAALIVSILVAPGIILVWLGFGKVGSLIAFGMVVVASFIFIFILTTMVD